MPLLRSTARRARDGFVPTCPRIRSIASFSTGALGRCAPVPVMYTFPSDMHEPTLRVVCLPGGLCKVGALACDALAHPRREEALDHRGHGSDREDHRRQKEDVEAQ